jgi:hypothetical protein
MFSNTFQNRVLGKTLFGAAMFACALWGAHGQTDRGVRSAIAPAEPPQIWQGASVRPLALSAVEQRFADRFPGRITRLTDGRQIVVLRDVTAPTRMLHPAADCYRALGYRIEGEQLEEMTPPRSPAAHDALPPGGALAALGRPGGGSGTASANAPLQRCFTASKAGVALRVCEHIQDAGGQDFADTSAWYWAAALGRSQGPWRAVTVTSPLGGDSV